MKEVTLGSNEFKALSSDNRVRILKMLNERKYTLTEISKKLGLASPSSKQHLEVLLKSNLVELIDEGRKWKYYSLARKGRDLLEAEERQTTVLLLLSLTGLIFFGLLFAYTNPNIFSGNLGGFAGEQLAAPGMSAEKNSAADAGNEQSVGGTAGNSQAAIESTALDNTVQEPLPEKPDTTPIAIALIIVAAIMIALVLQYGSIRKSIA